MKTMVYVDGFNLYYRALKGTRYKWLDLQALCKAVLPAHCEIIGINYYTARVSSRVGSDAGKDQNTYLKALKTKSLRGKPSPLTKLLRQVLHQCLFLFTASLA